MTKEEDWNIVAINEPKDIPWGIIGGGISAYNEEKAGDDHGKILCYVLRGPDEEIVGGVIGETHWDWFYVNLMWLKEEFRGQGYGHRILMIAEEEARQRGAKNVYLDTFSFQAPGFYKKHGYEVYGELKEFPLGHQRYFMKKQL